MKIKTKIIIALIVLAFITLGIGQFLEIPWVETLTVVLSGIWLGLVLIGLSIEYINEGKGLMVLVIWIITGVLVILLFI